MESGFAGTPQGYSNTSTSLDKKSNSDGESAINAMKRRLSSQGAYGDESEQGSEGAGKGHYPGAA